jgi:pyruvate dehydrogenase E2 component (dihydrolipoamide acetyltransferase)
MPINILMPALSPTMEKGTLAKWLVAQGDAVKSGQVIAEIETDKATMEFESADEGVIGKIAVAAGSEDVAVGTLIAVLLEEGETMPAAGAPSPSPAAAVAASPSPIQGEGKPVPAPTPLMGEGPRSGGEGNRILASPLAKRIAAQSNIDLTSLKGSGPGGRIVKADLGKVPAQAAASPATKPIAPSAVEGPRGSEDIPYEDIKLSGMRKTIARRLTESKQNTPHIYLTIDVHLDALLKLRSELNAALEARGIKLSVNDMLIKALALALEQVPQCNVSFGGDTLRQYKRADISVAVSIAGGLITPIIVDAASKPMSKIATEMNDLAARAKAGKLQPHEYQGGTASISNMGMMGIQSFSAVINPPQAMILAIGAGEKRPAVIKDALAIATMMSVTGSFDHRAIDGADGALLMKAFRELVEKPLGLVA